jgi:hypothetical protein
MPSPFHFIASASCSACGSTAKHAARSSSLKSSQNRGALPARYPAVLPTRSAYSVLKRAHSALMRPLTSSLRSAAVVGSSSPFVFVSFTSSSCSTSACGAQSTSACGLKPTSTCGLKSSEFTSACGLTSRFTVYRFVPCLLPTRSPGTHEISPRPRSLFDASSIARSLSPQSTASCSRLAQDCPFFGPFQRARVISAISRRVSESVHEHHAAERSSSTGSWTCFPPSPLNG